MTDSAINSSEFIEVEEGDTYMIYGGQDGTTVSSADYIYMAYNLWSSTYTHVDSGSANQNYYFVTIPAGVKYLTINYNYDIVEDQSIREVKNYFLVDFEMNGGVTDMDSLKIEVAGSLLTEPEDPIKANEDFIGWYTDEELTEKFNFDEDVVISDLTLYAKWTDSDTIGGGTVVTPDTTDLTTFLGVAWYWWLAGIAVFYFGFTKKGRKSLGFKK
jgi:uncharacterized repeat protein (TIGR02543 family)